MPKSARPLTILHVFRAPLGGLFRHVADLVEGQTARGHRVGIIADNTISTPHAEDRLAKLAERLELGMTRIPIRRQIDPRDFIATLRVAKQIREIGANVVHGHGAKGGAYARLAAPLHPAIRVYTPHGGSLLYRPGSLASRMFCAAERLLMPRTDLFTFESDYVRKLYLAKVGTPGTIVRVVHNGISAKEFVDAKPRPDATDILFIGELRPIKGVDVLLDAIAALRQSGLTLTATIVGDGHSRDELHAQSDRLGLSGLVTFRPPMPAREAFALGRLAAIPSRGESLPYIVLEIAAAALPMITTDVGGNPEIFGPQSDLLIPAGDRNALVAAIAQAVNKPETMKERAQILRARVRTSFSVEEMVDGVLAGYEEALRVKKLV